MADNITTPAIGTVLATDDIGGVHWPYTKIAFGAADAAVPVADANGARLPVLIGGALPAFAATPTFALDAPSLAALETVSITGSVAVTGTFWQDTQPVSAASLPLPTGASTEATLAALSAKFAALESGRAPVAVQTVARTTRLYDVANGIRPAVAATTGNSALPPLGATREIYIHPSVRTFFRTGTSGVTAAVAAGHHVVEAGEKFHWEVPAGHTHIAVIGDGGTGFAQIVAVA